MRRRQNLRTCPYCNGVLDPEEKCDCREMGGRNYTAIEGAGYRPVMIRPVSTGRYNTGRYNKKPAE